MTKCHTKDITTIIKYIQITDKWTKYEIAVVPELPILGAVLPDLENNINIIHNIFVEVLLKIDRILLTIT